VQARQDLARLIGRPALFGDRDDLREPVGDERGAHGAGQITHLVGVDHAARVNPAKDLARVEAAPANFRTDSTHSSGVRAIGGVSPSAS